MLVKVAANTRIDDVDCHAFMSSIRVRRSAFATVLPYL